MNQQQRLAYRKTQDLIKEDTLNLEEIIQVVRTNLPKHHFDVFVGATFAVADMNAESKHTAALSIIENWPPFDLDEDEDDDTDIAFEADM
jgi:hypothetical protein